MKELCKNADVIVPNLTEATAMLNIEYKEVYNEEYLAELRDQLKALDDANKTYECKMMCKDNSDGADGSCIPKKKECPKGEIEINGNCTKKIYT